MKKVIGLMDSNGRQVYDGCVIRYTGYRLEVYYDEKKFIWMVKDKGNDNFITRPLHTMIGYKFCIVEPLTEELRSTKEDMIVFWNIKGGPLARITFEDGEDLEKAEEFLYPAMMDVFGKDENDAHIVQNSSYEHHDEWEEQ